MSLHLSFPFGLSRVLRKESFNLLAENVRELKGKAGGVKSYVSLQFCSSFYMVPTTSTLSYDPQSRDYLSVSFQVTNLQAFARLAGRQLSSDKEWWRITGDLIATQTAFTNTPPYCPQSHTLSRLLLSVPHFLKILHCHLRDFLSWDSKLILKFCCCCLLFKCIFSVYHLNPNTNHAINFLFCFLILFLIRLYFISTYLFSNFILLLHILLLLLIFYPCLNQVYFSWIIWEYKARVL